MSIDRSLEAYLDASLCSSGYMNFAAIGPMLEPVVRARTDAIDTLSHDPLELPDPQELDLRCRQLASNLLRFEATHIATSPNTSAALFQTAFALPQGEVLVSPFDFPANVHPWLRAQDHGGARVRWLCDPSGPRPRITPELVASAITGQTVAVAVSAVDYVDGSVVDLRGVRAAIDDRLLVVDAIQALGAVDLPWTQADVVASGGQKWLRAGWGTGLLACSDRALDRLGPGLSGWTGARGGDDPRRLNSLASPRTDVQRFSMTAPGVIALAGLAAALECLTGVGIQTLSGRVQELVGGLRNALTGAGIEVRGCAVDDRCSGIVAFGIGTQPATDIVATLSRAGITVSEREGSVRVSVHASTDEHAVDRLVALINEISGQ